MCNDRNRSATRLLTSLLILGYPIAVHLGVLSGRLWPALLILLTLLQLPLWLPSRRKARWPALGLSGVLIAALLLTPLQKEQLLYLFPPAMVLMIGSLFGRTLLPGQTALVTRMAELMHTSLSPRLRSYTRAVTWAWVVFFTALLFETIWLAVFAAPHIWSLYTNFINYLLVAAFFLLEILLRRWVLPAHERLGFIAFFRALARIDIRALSR